LREVGFADDCADEIHLNLAGVAVESQPHFPLPVLGQGGDGVSRRHQTSKEALDRANNPQDTIQKLPNWVPNIPRYTNTIEGK
jgi:hypothetical protein